MDFSTPTTVRSSGYNPYNSTNNGPAQLSEAELAFFRYAGRAILLGIVGLLLWGIAWIGYQEIDAHFRQQSEHGIVVYSANALKLMSWIPGTWGKPRYLVGNNVKVVGDVSRQNLYAYRNVTLGNVSDSKIVAVGTITVANVSNSVLTASEITVTGKAVNTTQYVRAAGQPDVPGRAKAR